MPLVLEMRRLSAGKEHITMNMEPCPRMARTEPRLYMSSATDSWSRLEPHRSISLQTPKSASTGSGGPRSCKAVATTSPLFSKRT
eukprot:7559-Alexandrium_andersonii.AAC.1